MPRRFLLKSLVWSGIVANLWLSAPSQAQTHPTEPFGAAGLTPALAVPYSNWDERTVFAYLTAEIVAQEGATAQAADILWPQAQQLNQPELLQRVAQWAAQGGKPALALAAAQAWELAAPKDELATQTVDYFLIIAQRYALFSERVALRGKTVAEAQAAHYLRLAGLSVPANAAGNVYTALLRGMKPAAQDVSAHWLLARVAAKAQLKTEISTHVRAAATANPPLPEAVFALLRDEPVAATQAAHDWTERHPKSLDAWRTLGLLQSQQKRPQQAADAFANGLKLAPNDVLLHLERMEQLRAANQAAAARDSLLAAYAVRASITQSRAAQLLAEQLEEDYHPVKALEVYAIASALAKGDVPTMLSVQQRTLALKARQGDTPSLDALLALPKSESQPEQIEKLTYVAAAVLRDLRQGARAVALVQSLPASPDRDYELAMALDAAGQFSQAEVLLRTVLERNPKATHILNALGYGLVDRNASPQLLAEGTTLLEQAYATNPDSAAIADSLGWAYFRAGNTAKALPLLQFSYTQKRDPEVAAHLGELFFTAGKTVQARTIWAEGLSVDAQHPVLQSTLKRFGMP